MREELVSHKGRIISIAKNKISVEIVSQSACSACNASGLCGISESKKKIVEVPVPATEEVTYLAGQEVEVCLSRRKGLKAVLLSYVLPLAVLLILIVSLSLTSLSELAIGAASLAGVILYYLIIYLFRDSLAGDYEFYIKG